MATPLLFWIIFSLVILGMVGLDLAAFHKRAREVKPREALGWSLFWLIISLAFGASIYLFMGAEKCMEFLAGYAIEKTLSIDNIFVFSVIFQSLAIPLRYQHRVLILGIVGALVLRGLMICSGIALLDYFYPLLYGLGAFLIFTGIRMLLLTEQPVHLEKHPLIRFLQQHIPLVPTLHGQKFFIRQNREGNRPKFLQWHATPLFVALVMVEGSDVLFAIDSIPAIFAVTLDPFIVYTSNIFAILGLRSLYFLLAGAIHQFIYLKTGIALILCYVGLKIGLMGIYKIPVAWSLAIILSILGGSVILSVLQNHLRQGGRPCPR